MIGRGAAAIVALGLLLAACGDDGSSGASRDESIEKFIDLVEAAMIADLEPGDPFTEDDARCLAEGTVDAIGVDGLLELGLNEAALEAGESFDDVALSESQATAFTDALFDCIDFGTAMAAELPPGADVSDESVQCLGDGMESSDVLRDAMAQSFVDPDGADPFESLSADDQAEFLDLILECLSAEELIELGQS